MSAASTPTSSSEPELFEAFTPFRDVPVPVTVVLGTGRMSLRECLTLTPGSVIRLQQPAGSDLQISANRVRIAHGEVVFVDETIAVRVTHVLPIGFEGMT